MRTIPASMTWEILTYGRWYLLLATLGAIAFPSMILAALRHDGSVDPQDPSMLMMHIIMMLCNVLILGAALIAAQGKSSRLYAYPIRTSAIVAWRLLLTTLIIATQMALITLILNTVFNTGWPIWGPAMMAAAALAAIEAVLWLTEKSMAWLIIALAIVGAVLGLWFRSRYGSTFSDPQYYWQHVTPAEAFTMLATIATAYWVGVKAVGRNRCGEAPLSLGWLDWLHSLFTFSPTTSRRLNTSFQAQCWFEWQRKGWAMPAAVPMFLTVGFVVWAIASRRAEDLFLASLVSGAVLVLVGFIAGILFGNTGCDDADYAMGNFLSSRPMSDVDMTRAILLTAFRSVFVSWSIWAAAFLTVCGGLIISGSAAVIKLPDNIGWWYFPCTLIGPWMAVALMASITLLGRPRFLVQFLCGLILSYVAILLASKFLLAPPAQLMLARWIAGLVAGAVLIGSVWVFAAAHRRCLISTPLAWASAAVWFAATVIVALQLPAKVEPRLFGYLLVAAVISLAVAPLAAAPLALSLNRHR